MASFNPVTLLLLFGAVVGGLLALPFAWTAINLAVLATLGGLVYSRTAMAGLGAGEVAKGLGLSFGLHLAVATAVYWAARLVRLLAVGGAGLVT